MSGNRNMILVALAAFAGGIAVDRIIVSFRQSPGSEGERWAQGSTRGIPSQAHRSGGNEGGAGSRTEARAGERGRERGAGGDPEGEEGAIPRSVREGLELLERGGGMDAVTAHALLSEVPAGRHRFEVIEHLASHWARLDPNAAVAWARELGGGEQRTALESILHGWAETDPAGAASFVVELPNSEHRLDLVHGIAHHWAERDRSAALEWASSQSDPATRGRAFEGVVDYWAQNDPVAAASFAADLDGPYEGHHVLEAAARRWADQDPVGAIDWAEGLPAGDRQRATGAILRELAERDPSQAASLYERMTTSVPAPSMQAEGYRGIARDIASIWSSSSPQAAAAWATGLPEAGEVQREAVSGVAEHWLRLDSLAAGEWIAQLPRGDTRDAAAERVVGKFVHSDPATAFSWAATITDRGHRHGLMREVLSRWSVTEPGAAQTALSGIDVPDGVRAELNEVFENARPTTPAAGEPPPPSEGPERTPEGEQ